MWLLIFPRAPSILCCIELGWESFASQHCSATIVLLVCPGLLPSSTGIFVFLNMPCIIIGFLPVITSSFLKLLDLWNFHNHIPDLFFFPELAFRLIQESYLMVNKTFLLSSAFLGTATSKWREMQVYGKKLRSDAGKNYTKRVEKPADRRICI